MRERGNFSSLYIHVPFCGSKCGYCSFYSIPCPSEEKQSAYLAKLESDMKKLSCQCGMLSSVYVGGGTPTWLSSQKLRSLLGLIHGNFRITGDAEISVECNPETLDSEKADVIAEFANRISLGIQSFKPRFRDMLVRRGGVDSIFKAFDILSGKGLKNIGCDLIYGIPGQSLGDWAEDLDKAASLPVKHISAYCLSIEEGAALAKKNDAPADDEISAAMWEAAGDILGSRGFERYEISNYAIKGFECRHNLDIWFGGTYFGLGPAASSFDGRDRFTNPSDLSCWLNGEKSETDSIPPESRAKEILVMGLRTSQGWERSRFKRATGYDWADWDSAVNELIESGLLEQNRDVLKCTCRGFLFWNEIAERLI